MGECRTDDVLMREVEQLRWELAEANNVINAIRHGEVDALLVSKNQEDHIYILEGADHIYRVLVEEMQEGCAAVAADGSILFCNKNFAEILKIPLDRVIASSLYNFLMPRDREDVAHLLAGSKESFKLESALKTGDGCYVPVFMSASNLTIDQTNFTCLVVTDLTEQKRSKRFAQVIFNQAKEQIIVCDGQGVIIQANPAALAMFGERLVGEHFDTAIPLVPVSDGTRFRLDQVLDAGISYGAEVKYQRRDGKIFNLLVKVGQFNMAEEDIGSGYIVTLNDITDKWMLRNEMARLDRLNLIGEMAAGIGHEVRNPLTTVRGYLQMFQRKAKYADDYEHFTLMIEELDRANSIITDFLSLAKNKAIDMKPGNLNDTIGTLFPLVQADAYRLGHAVDLELGDIPSICYDDKEIRQLILNMVRNALEAMSAGGVVTIQTYAGHNEIILAIRDTGHGIPEEILRRLGTPFLTTKESGTGLGLSVCYRIADRHGAKIEVNTSAEGTTFFIKFKGVQT